MKTELEIRKHFNNLKTIVEEQRKKYGQPFGWTGLQHDTIAWVLGEETLIPNFEEVAIKSAKVYLQPSNPPATLSTFVKYARISKSGEN